MYLFFDGLCVVIKEDLDRCGIAASRLTAFVASTSYHDDIIVMSFFETFMCVVCQISYSTCTSRLLEACAAAHQRRTL